MKGRRVILRKHRTVVTENNYKVLQLLDLLSDITQYTDEDIESVSLQIKTYIKKEGIRQEDVDRYIRKYPERIYKNMYEMGFFDVFA